MTPNPKHIEEAQRLATEACDKLRFDYPGTLFHVRIPETAKDLSKHLNLPTLLAAQEELETLRKAVNSGSVTAVEVAPGHYPETFSEVLKERDQLRADLAHMREERDDAFQRGYESAEALRKQLMEAQGEAKQTQREYANLRTRETALLAVARAAKDVRENIIEHGSHDNWKTMSNALSALEPLGIKV